MTWDDGPANLPQDVAPGESVELTLTVNAPPAAGEYRLELDMAQEFVAWWLKSGARPVSREIRVREGPSGTQPEADLAEVAGDAAEVVGRIEMYETPIELVTPLLTHLGHEVIAALPDTLSPDGMGKLQLLRPDRFLIGAAALPHVVRTDADRSSITRTSTTADCSYPAYD